MIVFSFFILLKNLLLVLYKLSRSLNTSELVNEAAQWDVNFKLNIFKKAQKIKDIAKTEEINLNWIELFKLDIFKNSIMGRSLSESDKFFPDNK